MSHADHPTSSKAVAVLRVTSGNFLEMFDFFLFGFYATYIAAAFFPSHNEFTSLLATFMTFGAGFLMRPLGAVVLGAYIDKVGRRIGLIVTLSIMAVGTVLLAFTPSYASIGILAPVLVLIGRLLQGFSAGVELGGVSVYLAEIAPPNQKGFYVAWQSGSQQVAIIVAALIGYTLNRTLVRWICEFNGLAPCLVYRVIAEEEDLKASSETDKNVSEMGFELNLDAVRAKYGEGGEKKAPAPAPSLPAAPGQPPGPPVPVVDNAKPGGERPEGATASFAEAGQADGQKAIEILKKGQNQKDLFALAPQFSKQ